VANEKTHITPLTASGGDEGKVTSIFQTETKSQGGDGADKRRNVLQDLHKLKMHLVAQPARLNQFF
jgi:hypothetical protein